MPGPSDAQKRVEEFDRLLKAADDKTTASLVREYRSVQNQLFDDTEALTKIAQTKGLKPWQVMRMQRYRELQAQYIQNFDRYAEAAGGLIANGQRQVVDLARRGTEQTVIAGLPPGITMDNMANMGLGWNRLPDEAYRNFIGISTNGQPLFELLRPLGPSTAMGIRDTIGSGIALGYGPRKVAQQVADKSGMALSRALLISRTEITRAHREASRLDYQNNSHLVKGYRRVATKSGKRPACVACIALDGTKYPLNEPLNEHPNGRCSMVPDVLDYADLGLDVERLPEPPTARDWLENQPELVQRKVLKKARFDAWKKGDIQLNQLATVRSNTVWGDSAVVKPLSELGIAKPPPRPPKPPKLPKNAATRPTRRAAPKPPPEVKGDLVDPLTGNKVRGTKATPPEPQLPKEWEESFGDPDDFLDIAPVDADPAMIKYRGATGREAIDFQVKEQEAWARAAGGAVEVNYDGLSIRAAREVNLAMEATIVRNGWRPLDVITTQRLPQRGGEFGRAYAYQYGNGVHINAQSSGVKIFDMRQGSVRGWDKNILTDNLHVANEYKAYTTQLAKIERELSSKAELAKGVAADVADNLERSMRFVNRPERVAERGGKVLTELEYLQGRGFATKQDFIDARSKKYAEDLKKSIKSVTKGAERKKSQVYHPTQGSETLKEIVTHEIGHYGHRRWGYNYRNEVLKGKKGKEHARNLSEYALDSPEEHFAEAFAKSIWGDRKELSPEVLKLVDDVMDANIKLADKGFGMGQTYDALRARGEWK